MGSKFKRAALQGAALFVLCAGLSFYFVKGSDESDNVEAEIVEQVEEVEPKVEDPEVPAILYELNGITLGITLEELQDILGPDATITEVDGGYLIEFSRMLHNDESDTTLEVSTQAHIDDWGVVSHIDSWIIAAGNITDSVVELLAYEYKLFTLGLSNDNARVFNEREIVNSSELLRCIEGKSFGRPYPGGKLAIYAAGLFVANKGDIVILARKLRYFN